MLGSVPGFGPTVILRDLLLPRDIKRTKKANEAPRLVQPLLASRLCAITSCLYSIIFGALRSMLSLFVSRHLSKSRRDAWNGAAPVLQGVDCDRCPPGNGEHHQKMPD